MKKPAFSALVILALFALALPASAAPTKALTKPLLDKFIKDIPAIVDDLQSLDDDVTEALGLDGESDDEAFDPAAIKADMKKAFELPQVRKIMAKYGWGDNFTDVYFSVVFGYMCIAYEEFYVMYPSEETKAFIAQLKAIVHPEDLALVKANQDRIAQALDMDE